MKSVLHLETVGLNDDFFKIGGNSIKATLLVVHLNKLGYKLSIKEIMSLREIKRIAGIMKVKAETNLVSP